MSQPRRSPDPNKFNRSATLPYELRVEDFALAMQDVYDFFADINGHLGSKGLHRLDDMLRAANMSGLISDMLTASLAKHSRALVVNGYHNGHPDLIVQGRHPNNAIKTAEEGVEIKSTRNPGGKVDTHGGRDQWLAVFVYQVDSKSEPAAHRQPMTFREVYLGRVEKQQFKVYERGELGTRTSSLTAAAMTAFRESWLYLDLPPSTRSSARRGSASQPIEK
jgi:hypothetical protein